MNSYSAIYIIKSLNLNIMFKKLIYIIILVSILINLILIFTTSSIFNYLSQTSGYYDPMPFDTLIPLLPFWKQLIFRFILIQTTLFPILLLLFSIFLGKNALKITKEPIKPLIIIGIITLTLSLISSFIAIYGYAYSVPISVRRLNMPIFSILGYCIPLAYVWCFFGSIKLLLVSKKYEKIPK